MPNQLQIADDLSLPLDVVTETVAILAKRRAGKSYTARKLVEQLLAAGLQVVIIDPKGDWWGLRSSADGKRPGYQILIAGGEHGDVPIEASGGEVLARFVVEQRPNLLLDLSSFRKHEVATFMSGFLEALYRLKAREEFRTPVMLVIDEADAIAPQRPQKGEERMLGAAEDIVRRGGQRGLGTTLISQRSAVLNKNVLTQAQILIALRTMSPQDLAALDAWIEVHGSREERQVLFASLPSLPVGDAWVWSPGWPTAVGIFQRMHVARIDTFDSGATPKVGQKVIPPKSVAEVDLGALKDSLASTIAKAKADDPRELRRRIAELERQVASKPAAAPAPPPIEKTVEVRVIADEDLARLERLSHDFAQLSGELAHASQRVFDAGQMAQRRTKSDPFPPNKNQSVTPVPRIDPIPREHQRPPPHSVAPRPESTKLAGAERKILTVLAQHPEGATKNKVALLSGYAVGGGGFNNSLSALRTKGFIEGRGEMVATEAGLQALGTWEPLPEGPALLDHWVSTLAKAEGLILRVLVEAYPDALLKAEVAERTGYAADGGGFNNALSRLRTLELIEGRGDLKASDVLGEAARN